MSQRSNPRGLTFWLALIIILAALVMVVAVRLRWVRISFLIGPYLAHHWLSWIGTAFIAIYTPIYYIWKRRNPKLFRPLLNIHVIGNLTSVALITVHFTAQVSRPPQAFPDLGTGIVLYAAMLILVVTGFVQRFQLVKNLRYWRFWHVGTVITFYLTIVLHVLHGLGVI